MEKRSRAPQGDGSFYVDSSGRFVAMFELEKGPDGKRRRRKVSAKTRGDLQRKLFDLRVRGGGAIVPRASGTVGEFVDEWLAGDVKPNRETATYLSYEGVWRMHVEPTLGALPIDKFGVEHVTALYRKLQSAGVSTSMISRAARVMHRAIGVAIQQGQFQRPNPFGLVERPRVRASVETTVLDIAQATAFLAALRAVDDRYEALFSILITAGLRLGEALALRWSDIDSKKRTIAVRRSLSQAGGHHAFKATKTAKSRRSVEFGQIVHDALTRRAIAHKAEGHGSDLIFCTESGGPAWTYPLRVKHFYPALERAGLPRIRIHDLRHSMTSIGLATGTDVKVLAERLGHSTTRLTADRYSHVLPGMQRVAADAIDAAIGGKPKARFRLLGIKKAEPPTVE